MRIIEFIKRLFHREKTIEIKQKKDLNSPKKMKQKKDLNPPKKMKQTYVAKSSNYLDEQLDLFKTIQPERTPCLLSYASVRRQFSGYQ